MANQSTTNTTQSKGRTYPPGYGIVEPVANYRPWDIDDGFQSIYQSIKDHTMVDIFRLWTLWTLARRAPSGVFLEVGSWRGGSGALLASALRTRERPQLYLADTFAGVVKAGTKDPYYRGGEHNNTSPDRVDAFLRDLGLDWVQLLVGVFPEETAEGISEVQLSFCHIDVDVYQSARDVFDWAWPRMVPGGVAVFDDFGFYGCEGVTECVNEIMAEFPNAVVVPSLSGQAVVIKTALDSQVTP